MEAGATRSGTAAGQFANPFGGGGATSATAAGIGMMGNPLNPGGGGSATAFTFARPALSGQALVPDGSTALTSADRPALGSFGQPPAFAGASPFSAATAATAATAVGGSSRVRPAPGSFASAPAFAGGTAKTTPAARARKKAPPLAIANSGGGGAAAARVQPFQTTPRTAATFATEDETMFIRPEPPPHTSVDEVRARVTVRGQSGVLIGTCDAMCPQCEVQYIDGEVNRDWASQPGRIGYDIRCVLMCNALCPASSSMTRARLFSAALS